MDHRQAPRTAVDRTSHRTVRYRRRRHILMSAGALVLALAGCTFPTRPGPPLACVGEPLPTTAPIEIRVRGTIMDPLEPISGARETGFAFDRPITDPTPLAYDTFHEMTDSKGEFAALH